MREERPRPKSCGGKSLFYSLYLTEHLTSSIVERGIRRLGDAGASVMEHTPLLTEHESTDQVPTSNSTIVTPKSYGTTKNEEH